MKGLNRYYLDNYHDRKNSGIKCIFISHQKNDSDTCRKIADYLINAGFDVYFDEYDIGNKTSSASKLVESISKGIERSSHMLCVFSQNTLNSMWVPWEIGYAYNNTSISVLTLKGLHDYQLPEYLKTVPILRGTKSLNRFISTTSNRSEQAMINEQLLFSSSTSNHPLDNYLDWDL